MVAKTNNKKAFFWKLRINFGFYQKIITVKLKIVNDSNRISKRSRNLKIFLIVCRKTDRKVDKKSKGVTKRRNVFCSIKTIHFTVFKFI